MPRLGALSIDDGLLSSALTSIASVGPTITLKLKLRNNPLTTFIPTLLHLELLILNLHELYRTQVADDVLATCEPLPKPRNRHGTVTKKDEEDKGPILRFRFEDTLLCPRTMKRGPKAFSQIRIWENQVDSLLDPVFAYRSIRNCTFHPQVIRWNIHNIHFYSWETLGRD